MKKNIISNIFLFTIIITGCNGCNNENNAIPIWRETDSSVVFVEDISNLGLGDPDGPVENVIFWNYKKEDIPIDLVELLVKTYPSSDNLSCDLMGEIGYLIIVTDLNGDERFYNTSYENCGKLSEAQFILEEDMLEIFQFLFNS